MRSVTSPAEAVRHVRRAGSGRACRARPVTLGTGGGPKDRGSRTERIRRERLQGNVQCSRQAMRPVIPFLRSVMPLGAAGNALRTNNGPRPSSSPRSGLVHRYRGASETARLVMRVRSGIQARADGRPNKPTLVPSRSRPLSPRPRISGLWRYSALSIWRRLPAGFPAAHSAASSSPRS